MNGQPSPLTPPEQATVDALKKLMPYVVNQAPELLQGGSGFGKLSNHDLKVLIFHGLVAATQLILIGTKVEYPIYAPIITLGIEWLRRIAY